MSGHHPWKDIKINKKLEEKRYDPDLKEKILDMNRDELIKEVRKYMKYEQEPKPEEIYKGEPSTTAETLDEKLGLSEVEQIEKYYQRVKKKLLASNDFDDEEKVVLKNSLAERVERVKKYYR